MSIEYLAAVIHFSKLYHATFAKVEELLIKSKEKTVLVLAAGSGGGVLDLAEKLGPQFEVLLTDLNPDLDLKIEKANAKYFKDPVSAMDVPKDLKGVRVIYTALHHFKPNEAIQILVSAAESKQPIAVFEGTQRTWPRVFLSLFIPIFVFLFTPFIRPVTLSRIFWTYICPVMPLIIFWDGLISSLRTYTCSELIEFSNHAPSFKWFCETLRGPRGEPVISLIGYPLELDNL